MTTQNPELIHKTVTKILNGWGIIWGKTKKKKKMKIALLREEDILSNL